MTPTSTNRYTNQDTLNLQTVISEAPLKVHAKLYQCK